MDQRIAMPDKDVLGVLVTGFEHSGTTVISEVMRQHPDLDSGFEGGFLLRERPVDFIGFEPFYVNAKGTWRVSDEDMKYVCAADSWQEVYRRLRERSPVIPTKGVRLIDKTPRYMAHLESVLRKVPEVPCVAIVRDFRAVFWSSFKRTGQAMEEWRKKTYPITLKHTMRYARGCRHVESGPLASRVLVVQYEEFCLDGAAVARKIFAHLGLEFRDEYLDFGKPKYNLVHGQAVSTEYLQEYKGKLPESVCDELREYYAEFSDWFWEPSSVAAS